MPPEFGADWLIVKLLLLLLTGIPGTVKNLVVMATGSVKVKVYNFHSSQNHLPSTVFIQLQDGVFPSLE